MISNPKPTGHKIPALENLAVARVSPRVLPLPFHSAPALNYNKMANLSPIFSLQDQDSIDLTDNDISTVGNFPLSPRLRTLLLARNRVTTIQPAMASSVPNLTTLVLTANNVAELADLDPLRGFARLTHVSLAENPVTRKEVRTSFVWR